MSKYSKEFKEEAIRLSDEIGNKKAAAQLGLPYYTLANRRNSKEAKDTCSSKPSKANILSRECVNA